MHHRHQCIFGCLARIWILFLVQLTDARLRVKTIPNITTASNGGESFSEIQLNKTNDHVGRSDIASCLVVPNNEPASSSVDAVYETTPSNKDFVTEKPVEFLRSPTNEPSDLKTLTSHPRKYSSRRRSSKKDSKVAEESTTENDDIRQTSEPPHNGSWNVDQMDWTSRIFQRGQNLAKNGHVLTTTEKYLTNIRENVTTERTRTRYGWRIRKRNKKVIRDDEKEGTDEASLADPAFKEPAAYDTIVHDYRTAEQSYPTESVDDVENHNTQTQGKFSSRFSELAIETTTADAIETSEQINDSPAVGDSAGSEQQHEETTDEKGKTDDKKEEGSGGDNESEKRGTHGEKANKGYKSEENEDKVKKGHHDKETHKGDYDDDKGSKHSHEDNDGHYEAEDEEEGGKKGADHGEHENFKKGHSTRGGHVVHKKDEYEKKTEFFDENDDDGHGEKFGEYHEDHDAQKGGHFKKGHYGSALDEAHKDDKGHYEKNSHYAEDHGKVEKEGKNIFYENHQSYGKKLGKEHAKKFGYGPTQKNGHLVEGGGHVAAATPHNHSPFQKIEDHESLNNGGEEEEYDETGDDEPAPYHAEEPVDEEAGDDDREAVEDEDSSSYNDEEDAESENEQHPDGNAGHVVSEMLRLHPHAQFLNVDGPTYVQNRGLNSRQLRSNYPHTTSAPTSLKITLPTNQNGPHESSTYQKEIPNFVALGSHYFRQPSTIAEDFRRVPVSVMTPPRQATQPNFYTLPERSSFEVLDMLGIRDDSSQRKPNMGQSGQFLPNSIERNKRYQTIQTTVQPPSKLSYQVDTTYFPISITTGPM